MAVNKIRFGIQIQRWRLGRLQLPPSWVTRNLERERERDVNMLRFSDRGDAPINNIETLNNALWQWPIICIYKQRDES